MYSRKKPFEELPKEITAVWSCTNEGCNSWIRDEFAFEKVPTCLLCGSSMTRSMKELPMLVNSNEELNSLKQGGSHGRSPKRAT